MEPLWAPYQNCNGYWCFNHDKKISCRNILQTSVTLNFLQQCYTKGPWKDGKLQTNLWCCLLCPEMPHRLIGGESVPFNDASSHLLTDSSTFPHYYKLQYMSHCRNHKRRTITLHTTVNFNTLYISVFFKILFFPWYALIKNTNKNYNVKLNSALKNTNTDL